MKCVRGTEIFVREISGNCLGNPSSSLADTLLQVLPYLYFGVYSLCTTIMKSIKVIVIIGCSKYHFTDLIFRGKTLEMKMMMKMMMKIMMIMMMMSMEDQGIRRKNLVMVDLSLMKQVCDVLWIGNNLLRASMAYWHFN